MMKNKKRSKEHPRTTENRTVERRRLVFYLRLFDQKSSDIIGHLTDISTAGLMLVSTRPIEKDRVFQVRLILPREVAGRTELQLKIKCVWCRPDPIPNFHIAGFQFVEIDLQQKKMIDALHEEFSREDSLATDTS
jgi:hypothetical protein